jgi:hypothetical protein
MSDQQALATLIAKEEIRELALRYSRGIDRFDTRLIRSLYTKDGTDTHNSMIKGKPDFTGTADEFAAFLDKALAPLRYTGHHVCNHLISVNGDKGEGEVYALAYHIMSNEKGELVEDIRGVRYLDTYRKEDGQWRFADRTVVCDWHTVRPIPVPPGDAPIRPQDPSYAVLEGRLFARA